MIAAPASTRFAPRRALIAFALTAPAFLALDAVWLTATADSLYRPAIGHLMRAGFDVVAAAAFYLVYIIGMVIFVVLPATRARDAAMRGALFGLVSYSTYDLTNQATMLGWPWQVTIADLCWGTFATCCACTFARWAFARRPKR